MLSFVALSLIYPLRDDKIEMFISPKRLHVKYQIVYESQKIPRCDNKS